MQGLPFAGMVISEKVMSVRARKKLVMAKAFRPGAAVALVLLLVGAAYTRAWADSSPKDLFGVVFGDQHHDVSKVVVDRIDPWIMRVLGVSPHSFEVGQAIGDREAIIRDRRGIVEIEGQLRYTTIIQKGCYMTTYTAQNMPVAWAVSFYRDTEKVAAFYLDQSMCVSTGTALYAVDPQGMPAYLKRTFSFMNY